jgi:hypothetical protein
MTLNNSGNIHPKSRFVNQICRNTKSDLIVITEDKLENLLLKFLEDYLKINSWITPLTLFITILTTFLTTNFKGFIGFSEHTWESVFVIVLLTSLIQTIRSVYIHLRNRKRATLEYLIEKIKNF